MKAITVEPHKLGSAGYEEFRNRMSVLDPFWSKLLSLVQVIRPAGLSPLTSPTDAPLRNKVVVGSVNANIRHWSKGGEASAVRIAHGFRG